MFFLHDLGNFNGLLNPKNNFKKTFDHSIYVEEVREDVDIGIQGTGLGEIYLVGTKKKYNRLSNSIERRTHDNSKKFRNDRNRLNLNCD